MIGSLQQMPGHRLGHDDLADTFGVNMAPIRGTLREAQAEARSTLHRRRGARTAKLSVTDFEHSYRIKKAGETLACPWAGVGTTFLF
jgi:DNA-binding GntR family transcriptional regulator